MAITSNHVFVDTGAWFATAVPSDAEHAAALHWLNQNTQPLITTDYVVDETLTLLRARGHPARAIIVGEQFFHGNVASVYRLTDDDFVAAWDTFRRFSDKAWSFTDCTSKVVMERLGLTRAFALDHHFRQFGFVEVLP